MWWQTPRNQISSLGETDESIYIGWDVSSVDYWQQEVCASAVVMLDTPCSEVVWRVLYTHSIRQFPLDFPSLASPCAITFQLDSTWLCLLQERDTGVYIASGLRVRRPRNRRSIHLLHKTATLTLGFTNPSTRKAQYSFSGGHFGSELNTTSPSNAEERMLGALTPFPYTFYDVMQN
jgi:hypothetical protein